MKYLWLAQLVPFAILLYLYFQNRSMKKRQDALANDLQGQRYWRINLAKPEFYKRWLRFMPFEAKGLLIDEGNQLRIKGEPPRVSWRPVGLSQAATVVA